MNKPHEMRQAAKILAVYPELSEDQRARVFELCGPVVEKMVREAGGRGGGGGSKGSPVMKIEAMIENGRRLQAEAEEHIAHGEGGRGTKQLAAQRAGPARVF